MKLTITREELLPLLQVICGVVERRQTLPILSNLLLSVSENLLRLTATDMEVELSATISKPLSESGEATLPARKLLDICRTLPENASINLNLGGDRAQVQSGKSRFTLSTLPAREYPLIDMSDVLAEFTTAQSTLKALLEKTAFAMAQQDVRYYLNGLLLELDQGKIRAVATDGHRLALCDAESDIKLNQPTQIIIPRKGVLELTRLLKDDDTEVQIKISSNHIRITHDDLQFTSKLIDGKFPDYDRVIPEQGNSPVLADREALRQSLTRASILSNEKYRGVRILLEKGKLKAIAHNPEQEEAEEEIEVDYDGAEMEIGFNVSYLLDALGIIKTDKARITINDPNSSCLILAEDSENTKYVVMPMRL